eukprot:5747-Heterococcus_DN1.PRE.2
MDQSRVPFAEANISHNNGDTLHKYLVFLLLYLAVLFFRSLVFITDDVTISPPLPTCVYTSTRRAAQQQQ